MTKQRPSKTSAILENIVQLSKVTDDVSVRDFVIALGDRAFGMAILIFTLPNCLPIPSPPGLSTVTGSCILFFAFQLLIGKKALWLPRWIGDKRFSQRKLAVFIEKSIPYVRKLEVLLKPRMILYSVGAMDKIVGFFITMLAFILLLPIPFGNLLPGLSIAILALGLIEEDGLVIIGGIISAIASTFVISSAVFIVVRAFINWLMAYIA